MIVNNQGAGAVDASGVESNKAFNIKMGGKAFKLLSDTLYTNKPGSIVRELSCNAFDSHKAAGKADVPFEIHLPSVYEPTFYVRDFGLGMSPEMIENTYTTYFDSTKDKDNNSIGGMGLGGKTPFAYTKSFNVTSVYNGVKYFYCAMLDENDVPSISRFGSEETTDVNGVTIEFNVEAADYRRFINEVREQLRFFAVKPTILNNSLSGGLAFDTIEYKEDFGNLKVPRNLGGMWIVQGGVGYKVDYNQFADKIDDKDKLEFFSLYPNMVMFFDIGQIEVTISREGVSYSKHTIDSVVKFVDEYAPKIFKDIKTKIESMKSDWERLVYLNADATNRKFAKLAKLTLGVDGNIGDQKATVLAGANYMLELTKHWRGNVLGKRGFQMAFFQKGKTSRKYFNDNELTLSPQSDMVIFLRDNAKYAIGRMKNYIEMNPYKQVYMIEHSEGADKVDAAFIQHMRDIFGGVEMPLISDLPEPAKNSAGRRGQVVVYEHASRNHTSYFKNDSISSWGRVYDEEELESGYFLEYETYPYIKENSNNINLVARVFGAGLFDKPIYVIKDKKAALLKDNPNFTSAVDKAAEIIAEKKAQLLKSKVLIDRYNLANMFKTEMHTILSTNGMLNHLVSVSKEFDKSSMVSRLARARKAADKYAERVSRMLKAEKNDLIRELLNQQTMDDKTRKANLELVKNVACKKQVENFYNKYPMLRELERNSYGWMDAKEQNIRNNRVVDYMKLVDKLG